MSVKTTQSRHAIEIVCQCSTFHDITGADIRSVERLDEAEELLPHGGAQVICVLVLAGGAAKLKP